MVIFHGELLNNQMVNGKHLENFFKIETFSMVILTYQPIAREAKKHKGETPHIYNDRNDMGMGQNLWN
jgi:hypothetical protein